MEFKVNSVSDVDAVKEQIIKIDRAYNIVNGWSGAETSHLVNLLKSLEEEESHGLSPYAFCINGEMPIYQKAQELINQIEEAKLAVSNLTVEVLDAATMQRIRELQKLKTAINELMEETREKISREKQNLEKNSSSGPADFHSSMLRGLESTLTQLSNKLREVEIEINQLQSSL